MTTCSVCLSPVGQHSMALARGFLEECGLDKSTAQSLAHFCRRCLPGELRRRSSASVKYSMHTPSGNVELAALQRALENLPGIAR
jgi:hypothetical protein